MKMQERRIISVIISNMFIIDSKIMIISFPVNIKNGGILVKFEIIMIESDMFFT